MDQTEASLEEGATLQLTATVAPEDATNKDVVWTSSDDAIATVDETGLVTAVAPGTATITATVKGTVISATCALTVTKKVVPATDITLDKQTVEMVEGTTLQLTATIEPENATTTEIEWTSSNEEIATV